MQALGSVGHVSVKNLAIYQLSFVVVSYCGSVRFHLDNEPSLSGKAWTVLIPVKLVPKSHPEFVVRNSQSENLHFVKYEYDTIVAFGADTDHSPGVVCYTSGYRVCLAISVGYICSETAKDLMLGVTQCYPPLQMSFFMKLSRSAHWYSCKPFASMIPKDDALVVGDDWLCYYNKLVQYKARVGHCSVAQHESLSLWHWIEFQQYCYRCKHTLTPTNSYGRTMTSL
jgi:hypothetical protein